MARLSVYVRDDLKEQMDEAGDAINWSEVVRPAILAALAAYKHRTERNMSTAIERLRASKQQSAQEDETYGLADGRKWAEDEAEFIWLKRLADDHDNYHHHSPEHAFDLLIKAIDPDNEMDRDEIREMCFGDVAGLSDDYVHAFVQGAVAFFNEVRNQI